MAEIQAKLRYGLRAALYLAENHHGEGQPIKVNKIASATEIPSKYLVHILLSLKRRALVNSTRGPAGGYWLMRRPGLINVWEIVEAIEQDQDSEGPTVREIPYDEPINAVWTEVERRRQDYLSGITLADLLAGS